jgi:hypothetical protein
MTTLGLLALREYDVRERSAFSQTVAREAIMKTARFLPFAALVLIWGQAVGQPPSSCETPSIGACRGDRSCISEAERPQVECRATQDRGNRPVVSVPEPATFLLLGAGLIGIALSRHRRQR